MESPRTLAITDQRFGQKHYVTIETDTCHPPIQMWLARVVIGIDYCRETEPKRIMIAYLKDSGSNG